MSVPCSVQKPNWICFGAGKLQFCLRQLCIVTAIFEPIPAGIAVAIFNRHILKRFGPVGSCYTHCCEKDDDDCVSSSSTSVVSDACNVHRF